MPTKTGQMATDRPERYAKQLASHWAKRGPATAVSYTHLTLPTKA